MLRNSNLRKPGRTIRLNTTRAMIQSGSGVLTTQMGPAGSDSGFEAASVDPISGAIIIGTVFDSEICGDGFDFGLFS